MTSGISELAGKATLSPPGLALVLISIFIGSAFLVMFGTLAASQCSAPPTPQHSDGCAPPRHGSSAQPPSASYSDSSSSVETNGLASITTHAQQSHERTDSSYTTSQDVTASAAISVRCAGIHTTNCPTVCPGAANNSAPIAQSSEPPGTRSRSRLTGCGAGTSGLTLSYRARSRSSRRGSVCGFLPAKMSASLAAPSSSAPVNWAISLANRRCLLARHDVAATSRLLLRRVGDG